MIETKTVCELQESRLNAICAALGAEWKVVPARINDDPRGDMHTHYMHDRIENGAGLVIHFLNGTYGAQLGRWDISAIGWPVYLDAYGKDHTVRPRDFQRDTPETSCKADKSAKLVAQQIVNKILRPYRGLFEIANVVASKHQHYWAEYGGQRTILMKATGSKPSQYQFDEYYFTRNGSTIMFKHDGLDSVQATGLTVSEVVRLIDWIKRDACEKVWQENTAGRTL